MNGTFKRRRRSPFGSLEAVRSRLRSANLTRLLQSDGRRQPAGHHHLIALRQGILKCSTFASSASKDCTARQARFAEPKQDWSPCTIMVSTLQ